VSSGFFSKRNVAILLGAALVLGVVLIGVIQGYGHDDVPDDSVAIVDGEEITQADFDTAFQQAASQAGLQTPPAPGDEQYEQVRDQALTTLLDTAWIVGEGERKGVEVTDKEVQDTFAQLKDQNFKTEEEYQQFLQQSGLTQEDIDERVRLQVISQKIQEEITADTPEVSDEEAQEFYDANKSQFEQPEARDIRVIVNKDPAQVEQALTQLESDNSPESWNRVAAEFSTDPTSKDKGGVRAGVTPDQFEDPLNTEIFDASEGQVEGPVHTSVSDYAFQVDSITPGEARGLDDPAQEGSDATVRDQIKQQLGQQAQQEQFASFLADYRDYWVELTTCGDDFLTERCNNFKGNPAACPDPSLTAEQQQQQLEQSGCPPPVLTISPAPPGTITAFQQATGGQPQKPHPAGEAQASPAQSIPGGAGGTVPVTPGAGGSTQVPAQ
jgi:parvulin-like peptidyl-prolyl isomerase